MTQARFVVERCITAGFDAAVRARYPGHRITAAVYDTRTGCTYTYRGELRLTTASVLKAAIMGATILRAQDAGRALTAREVALIGPMIRTSDDPSANALWSSLGGTAAMTAFDRRLGLGATTETSPWGLTSTSAVDRNLVLRRMLLGEGGPFTASSRARARAFMLDVTPSQRWGITAGVPSAWAVPLKNGFFPASCCGWRVNTSGVVERPGGGAYVATVLSDGWPSLEAGIPAVELVARTIASWTLTSIGPHPSAARAATQSFVDVETLQAALTRVFAEWVQELDLRVLDARAGEVTLALPVTRKHVHEGGVLCGQTMMAACDTAMVLAIMTRLGGFKPMTTVQLQTSFIRPISGSSGAARVIARVLRMGKNLVFGEIQVVNADDELAAHATTTYALL